jgi:hypothetical protein
MIHELPGVSSVASRRDAANAKGGRRPDSRTTKVIDMMKALIKLPPVGTTKKPDLQGGRTPAGPA